MTRRFGSLSKFACLRITTPNPLCFKKQFSAVGVVAVFLSESFGTVIDGDVGNGVGVQAVLALRDWPLAGAQPMVPMFAQLRTAALRQYE